MLALRFANELPHGLSSSAARRSANRKNSCAAQSRNDKPAVLILADQRRRVPMLAAENRNQQLIVPHAVDESVLAVDRVGVGFVRRVESQPQRFEQTAKHKNGEHADQPVHCA